MGTTFITGLPTRENDTGSGTESLSVGLAIKPDITSPSGGTKHDSGKVRWDLAPPLALEELMQCWTIGARKYQDRNWEKGLSYGRTFSALMRHAWAFWRGESRSPDDGQYHLAAVAWNALALLHFEIHKDKYKEFDNRPCS